MGFVMSIKIPLFFIVFLCGCNSQQDSTSCSKPENNPVKNQTISPEKKLLEKKLFKAIKHDDLSAVKELIAQGVNINAYNEKKGRFVVEVAGRMLFDGGGRITNSPSADLEIKKIVPQETILWHLIECGASLDKCEWLVRTIVRSGNRPFVELLIKKGIDLSKYKGVLLDAAGSGDEGVFKLVLSRDSDINYQDEDGTTALMTAVVRSYDIDNQRNETIVKILLERGADVNHKNKYDRSALAFAMIDSSIAIVKLLLQNKANIYENKILMHHAVQAGWDRKEKVELLLAQNFSLEEKNKDGQTPLHWAAGSVAREWRNCADPDMIKLLLENGANVNATDNNGKTPLINHILNTCDFDADTMLKVVPELLKFGADLSIKDKDGKRAEDYLQELMKRSDEPKFKAVYELFKKNS